MKFPLISVIDQSCGKYFNKVPVYTENTLSFKKIHLLDIRNVYMMDCAKKALI